MGEEKDTDDLLPEARADEPGPPPRPVSRPRAVTVVPRWLQLVAVLLAGFALYAVAKASGPVLLLFLTAAITALILNPLVATVQRARVPRGLAILVVYLGFFTTLAVVGTVLANPIAD